MASLPNIVQSALDDQQSHYFLANHTDEAPKSATNGHIDAEAGPSTIGGSQSPGPSGPIPPSRRPTNQHLHPPPARSPPATPVPGSPAQSFSALYGPSARRPNPYSSPSQFSQASGIHRPPVKDSDPYRAKFVRNSSSFRGAWEYNDADGKGKGREGERERPWRRRHSAKEGEPMWKKWEGWRDEELPEHEDEHAEHGEHDEHQEHRGRPIPERGESAIHDSPQESRSASPTHRPLQRHQSLPHIKTPTSSRMPSRHPSQPHLPSPGASPKRPEAKTASSRWAVLRSRLLAHPSHTIAQANGPTAFPLRPGHDQDPHSAAGDALNLSDELLAGPLSGLMLRMHFERDEQNDRRVPVFLHHLRIRVSDSVHPLHNTHAVFRIECEYANGAARWVIYRELRDFLSLHTHYRVANAYSWGSGVELPEFPRTSLPYFKWLKKEGKEKGGADVTRAEFARLQREALENYLIGLIRATMFRAEANRLCRFFEISALSVSLAQRGGVQGKAGILRVIGGHASRKGKGHHSLLVWKKAHEPKWWLVRESYMVAVDDAGSSDIYDVFLFDGDFVIERPKRYLRKGLNMLHLTHEHHQLDDDPEGEDEASSHIHFHSDSDGEADAPPSPGHAHGANTGNALSRLLTRDKNTKSEKKLENGSAEKNGEEYRTAAKEQMRIDPSTQTDPRLIEEGEKGKKNRDVSQHTFFIQNAQRRLKLVARNERQMQQWIASIERMATHCVWKGKNRFESYAPIRLNVAAQWLVDGRDYFWNLSRAMLLAKECIYIHDWWLSPELYLRRPNKENYRLDQILKRKAREGVKIYVIIYQEVSSRTTPTDSNYTKQRLTELHPNIMVQRSPSHFMTGNFYWAHHEKMCVIDEAIAFMGGFDLCFGRWDTSQHIMIDQGQPGGHGENAQVWPGKDYNNARVSDFHTLNKPFDDLHDRHMVPRMPWHDVGLQMVGQPARDLCRHFVQRWNWLLRVKSHTRVMPFLLPPPDFDTAELEAQGLTGTCEVQICRSCGPWSMGTQNKIELSIQNAYLKAIQMSEHFIYIENQFFVTSTVVDDVKVENKIGDALVARIIRAHQEGTPWRAVILIPLFPGFSFPIDHSDASSLRIVLECQNRSICRGPDSIFGRLKTHGIDPDDYISFFSLRGWGKFDSGILTTEMVYIHGKIMLVDDRVALIGSANINERSQRGDRDSELVAVIRDTDMIDGKMAGKPFKVGRFVHTLRVRLMREHIGVDVDSIYDDDLMATKPVKPEEEIQKWDPEHEQQEEGDEPEEGVTRIHHHLNRVGRAYERDIEGTVGQFIWGVEEIASNGGGRFMRNVKAKMGLKSDHINAGAEDKTIERERHMIDEDGKKQQGFASSVVATLEEKTIAEHRPHKSENGKPMMDDLPEKPEFYGNGAANGKADDSSDVEDLFGAPALAADHDEKPPTELEPDELGHAAVKARQLLRKHLDAKVRTHPWTVPTPAPKIDADGFEDPIAPGFIQDMWIAAAVHNTEAFRKVFRCVPDDLVTTWKQYKEYASWQDRLNRAPKDADAAHDHPVGVVPSEDEGTIEKQPHQPKNLSHIPGEIGNVHMPGKDASKVPADSPGDSTPTPQLGDPNNSNQPMDRAPSRGESTSGRGRKPSRPDEPFEQWERDEMEELLKQVRGHLVVYPTRFLEGEDMANNFLFTSDRILPMPIYD